MKMSKLSFYLCLATLLMRCAGTGTKDIGAITMAATDRAATTVFVLRDTGYSGSANLLDVTLDGVIIANLGDGETVTYPVAAGNHALQVGFRGLGGVGVNEPMSTFEILEAEKKFFSIQLRAGVLTNTLLVTEVSRDSFFSIFS